MEVTMVVEYGVCLMIQIEKVFQAARWYVRRLVDIMDSDGLDFDACSIGTHRDSEQKRHSAAHADKVGMSMSNVRKSRSSYGVSVVMICDAVNEWSIPQVRSSASNVQFRLATQ